jgi:nucleoside-diphosphate-sugar epimerase
LVTGAAGQIGSELTMALREKYGNENVIATGHTKNPDEHLRASGPFQFIDFLQVDKGRFPVCC